MCAYQIHLRFSGYLLRVCIVSINFLIRNGNKYIELAVTENGRKHRNCKDKNRKLNGKLTHVGAKLKFYFKHWVEAPLHWKWTQNDVQKKAFEWLVMMEVLLRVMLMITNRRHRNCPGNENHFKFYLFPSRQNCWVNWVKANFAVTETGVQNNTTTITTATDLLEKLNTKCMTQNSLLFGWPRFFLG